MYGKSFKLNDYTNILNNVAASGDLGVDALKSFMMISEGIKYNE